MRVDPPLILEKLKFTLQKNDINFEVIINKLGQVEASNKRENGEKFTIEDHLKALILSMLSSQRQWRYIMLKLDQINEIFFHYDHKKIQNTDPEEFITKIKTIKCGNRSITVQMKSLNYNITQLSKIENDFGSLDKFLTENAQNKVVKLLSRENSAYKLQQIGPALAMEYLKNVGISSMKPDLHIIRICGPERLDIIPSTNPEKQLLEFKKFADEANVTSTYLDNLFWIFGAKGFGEICSKTPKCDKCELKIYCNYP